MADNNVAKYMSPYKRGADDGFYFGGYLALLFVVFFYQWDHRLLAMPMLLLVLGVPVIVFGALRRSYLRDGRTTLLSSLWMQGIVMFFCGSLISGLVAYIMMTYVEPGWLVRIVRQMAEIFESQADDHSRRMAMICRNMLELRIVPSPIAIVFQSVWAAVLTGSLLSLLMGLLVRSQGPARPKHPRR